MAQGVARDFERHDRVAGEEVTLRESHFDIRGVGCGADGHKLGAGSLEVTERGPELGALFGRANSTVDDVHAWLDHYLRDVDSGVENHPVVQGWLPKGSRQAYLAGDFTKFSSSTWPLQETTWQSLYLDPKRSGSAFSLNDGSLSLAPSATSATASYATVPTLPMATDVPTWALLDAGAGGQASKLPIVTDMQLAELTGLSFTTPALSTSVRSVGPLSLEVPLRTTTPGTAIWAVLSDVAPDGTVNPLTVGRLNTDFPNVIRSRSLVRQGQIVQPYADFSRSTPAKPGESRRYWVELWPGGNEFQKDHRIRLDVVGTSAASKPGLPGLHTIGIGGATGAQLHFPVAPGSDLASALPQ